MGQINYLYQPAGFVRMITEKGYIIEGIINTEGQRDGWCVKYSGYTDIIYVGWYREGLRNGNYMEINAGDMSVRVSGWYKNDRRIGKMREDSKYQVFDIENVFHLS